MRTPPPKYAVRFLRWFCREDYVEEIEGDLTEIFRRQNEDARYRAQLIIAWSLLKYFRPGFIKSFGSEPTNPLLMLRHNLLISYRNSLRYKGSFFINLVGLSTGLAAVLLIALWVHDELSIDKFHAKDSRLYEVLRNIPVPGGIETTESNSILLPTALETEMPGIEYVVPVRHAPGGILSFEENHIEANAWFAGKDFFDVFSFELISGDRHTVLNEKYAMVISDEAAVNLFGSVENSIGKSITWDLGRFGGTHVVSGVFRKPGQNSSAQFDCLVTHELFLEKNRMDVSWDSNPIFTYVTLKPGAEVKAFGANLNAFYRSKRKELNDSSSMFLQRYSERYLYDHFENGQQAGGRISYVVLFSLIAAFILIIACINFMNLSTARASRRLKEVGVKKSIGARRTTLIWQYTTESITITLLSFVLALLLAWCLLPQFNLISGKHLSMQPDWRLLVGGLTIALVTGLVSGSYPAIYLSSFRPAEVLKGKMNTSWGELWVRRGLVVFQFSVSILMVVAVGIVYLQMNLVQSRNLGYTKDNVITIERQGKLISDMESFLSETRNISGVLYASCISESITNVNSTSWGHVWEDQQPGGDQIEFSGLNVGYDLIETLSLKMKEGRSFSRDFANEESSVMLNEAAVHAMGLKDPVGKWMDLFGTKKTIVGVVKDFHFRSMYTKIRPIFMLFNPKYTDKIVVKVAAADAVEKLTSVYHRFDPGVPFEVKFLDDEYQALYVSEQRVALLSKGFASIALIISCLGLFGLASFTAERRTKEIGIRKILGCNEFTIVRMLSGDLTMMVVLSIVITLPFSYWLANQWLSGFAYRIELEWWHYFGAGMLVMFTAWMTVGVQLIKAARTNAVECLRSE
jgi:ABC-type antimicrobial peptide transport system permease subunit